MTCTFLAILGLQLFLLVLSWGADGFEVQPVQIPQLDFSEIGRVAFIGDFEALSLYQYTERSSNASAPSGNGGQSILQQLPNGDLVELAEANGPIEHVGAFVMHDGTYGGTIVVGNFTAIAGIPAEGIAMFNTTSRTVSPMPGLSGPIFTLLMDGEDRNTFYVGGDFSAANSGNVLAWVGTSGWASLPFGGFNGPVNSIAKLSDGSLAFGGSFDNLLNRSIAANISALFQGNSTELSGLFGFNPSASTEGGRSAAVTRTKLDPGAVVNDLVSYNNSLFVAGAFQSRDIHNIFVIENDTSIALSGGGLNARVNTLYLAQDLLFAGGDFTDTANKTTGNLSHVAVYSILDQNWQALGAGVNGPISHLNPLEFIITPGSAPEIVVVVNGDFNQLQEFGNNSMASVDGLGIWVPSANNWLQNIAIDQQAFHGQLSSCSTNISAAQETDLICAGTLSSYGLRASSAIGLITDTSQNLELVTLGLQTKSSNGSGAATGLFYSENGLNLTIIAGQFIAEASDKSVVQNLAFINNTDNPEIVSGMNSDFGSNFSIQSLATQSTILYAGGVLAGKVKNQNVEGIFAYNLSEHDFSVSQPPALEGNVVEVKAMKIKPQGSQLYVGGSFAKAGLIDCPSVCVYDTASQNWSRPGTELSGSVTYLTWTDDETLIAAGNIAVGGVSYSLATFYVPDGEWTPFREDQPIPGQITAMSPTGSRGQDTPSGSAGWSSDSAGFWIAGTYPNSSAFLMKWGNDTWLPVNQDFGNPSKITGVEVVSLDQDTAGNEFLDSGRILVLTGSMNLPQAGNASATLFNGTYVWPLVLTTGADGSPGSLSQMFSEQETYFAPAPDPKGTVVAIAVAVIAVLISIIIIGEVSEICRRHWLGRKGYGLLPRRTET
ncbi:hypothetical protein HO133_002848 [Letharia lupina]|uniref:Rax2-like C-terminal domain-containing protein n=1 Tax=Letharia lupina TaxID=560253 RepID=A0A8H6F9Y8_9LECA|nr:uncharacterized protein HO133_002848 [Letharia lupina]KAF6220416.1 hypothetical protein HO133_002848 [Letharia lupina]